MGRPGVGSLEWVRAARRAEAARCRAARPWHGAGNGRRDGIAADRARRVDRGGCRSSVALAAHDHGTVRFVRTTTRGQWG
ncbi:hypothetical protein ISF6_1089 [Piscinibacter sakaiensis]|uniref:Uncharacterized protein n=1 Tax=Piscinibacter sakaiensis TaxID=1547922 RepID=A0A0K8NU94_PISS1|nr:hypothetical protein ISF6_1089 [Piscinibacter sakaiensis]